MWRVWWQTEHSTRANDVELDTTVTGFQRRRDIWPVTRRIASSNWQLPPAQHSEHRVSSAWQMYECRADESQTLQNTTWPWWHVSSEETYRFQQICYHRIIPSSREFKKKLFGELLQLNFSLFIRIIIFTLYNDNICLRGIPVRSSAH